MRLVLVRDELVNDGSYVTLAVLEQVAVEVNVEETHAVERLEGHGVLLVGVDSVSFGLGGLSGGLRHGGGDDGLLSLSSDDIDPNAGTKGGTSGTMHAPVRNVATGLLGSLHLNGDGDVGSGRDLAGNIYGLYGAQAVSSVGFERETASKRPGGVAGVRQAPNLAKHGSSDDLRAIGDSNVVQEGHLEKFRGDELRGGHNGALVGGSFHNLGLARRGRGNGVLLGLCRSSYGASIAVVGVASVVSMVKVGVAALPAGAARHTSGIHGERVIFAHVHARVAASIAQVEIGASIALVDVSRDGAGATAVASVVDSGRVRRGLCWSAWRGWR